MANYKIYKNIRITGDKGERGDAPIEDKTTPIKSIVFYDGEEIPEGYDLYREDNTI